MEIKISIEANIIVENGETNINEILYAIGSWSKQIGLEVCKGVIENYQKEMVKLLCDSQGKSCWVKHEHKGEKGQMCIGGDFRPAGFIKKERKFKTDIGNLNIKMQQIICNVCGKRFAVLLPLLNIAAWQRSSVKIKHMMSEIVTDLSYRKGSSQLEGLAEVVIPKTTLHRWMSSQNWEI